MEFSTFNNEHQLYTDNRKVFWDSQSSRARSGLRHYYAKRLQNVYALNIPQGCRILDVGCGHGDLLASLKPSYGYGIDLSDQMVKIAQEKYSDLIFSTCDVHDLALEGEPFDYILLSDIINDIWDVQAALEKIRPLCHSNTRICINFFSQVWRAPLKVAKRFGLATPTLMQNWLTPHDVKNLLELSGFETMRNWQEIVVPLHGANILNKYLSKIPPFRWFSMTNFMIARPIQNNFELPNKPTVSVIVAARNESGHIHELLHRIPEMGAGTEIIFVEGNSTDDTYEVIKSAISSNPGRNCKLLKQPGKGKGDAVRTGFDAATGDILMILDADITVPPEDLPRFYESLASGKGDFSNGVRLVYPMEEDAMRFANILGNKFFAFAFSWLLGQQIRDTLCGTKVLWRCDYKRIAANRNYFGDFDPFGDFDLLFGAAKLNMKIVEVPIRYRARRYGETNIQRWRHGLLLLRMVLFAARRIKFV